MHVERKQDIINYIKYLLAEKEKEIKDDFNNGKRQKGGMPAKKYKPFTKLDFPQKEIDALLKADIMAKKRELSGVYLK